MRIPLTKYGLPEVLVYPAAVAAIMVVFGLVGGAFLPILAVASIEIILAGVAVWVLSFFRDPQRPPDLIGGVQADDPDIIGTLLAPADGRITDVEIVQENEFIGASALRIGIFLSIFDTHINRSPCNARVEKVTFKPGKYKNAADPRSGRVNQSNDLHLVRLVPSTTSEPALPRGRRSELTPAACLRRHEPVPSRVEGFTYAKAGAGVTSFLRKPELSKGQALSKPVPPQDASGQSPSAALRVNSVEGAEGTDSPKACPSTGCLTAERSRGDKLVVRQISGAIARRIVCQAREGQELAAGEKFGMIKFGSRTELYVPIREDLKCLVKIGDKVKAGLTPLVKYEIRDQDVR
jgi:phosphatidylserine decarboxylase